MESLAICAIKANLPSRASPGRGGPVFRGGTVGAGLALPGVETSEGTASRTPTSHPLLIFRPIFRIDTPRRPVYYRSVNIPLASRPLAPRTSCQEPESG